MAQGRITFITFEEFQKIYRAEKNKIMKLCILLGFGSGLRISEIVGLERKIKQRKDKKTGIVKYYRDETSIPKLTKDMIFLQEHQIRLVDGKGKKWRTTITSPLLEEPMLKWLPIKIPRRTLQYRFEKLCLRVLGKKMSFHTLRHGFGNYQANVLKVPLPIVQSLMGHSRLDTTGIYTRANPEQAIAASWKAMTGEK